MIELTQIDKSPQPAQTSVTLDYDARTRGRLRVTLDNGQEAGIFISRGKVLKHGDILSAQTGERVRVIACDEAVSTVTACHFNDLLLACYHLGNRHVSLEITDSYLRYRQDHVLDEMVRHLGLNVIHEHAPFSPESGAYQASAHHHGGTHAH